MMGLWLNVRPVMNALKTSISKENVCFVSLQSCRRLSLMKLTSTPERSYHKHCVSTNVTQSWMKQQRHCSALRCPDSLPEFRVLQSAVNIPSRSICTSPSRLNAGESNATLSVVAGSVGQVKPKLALKYKCKICDHENCHTFSKESYESGVVIVQCQSCNSHHLVADNLGWFADKDRQKSVKGMLESKVKVSKSAVRKTKQEDGTIEIEVDK